MLEGPSFGNMPLIYVLKGWYEEIPQRRNQNIPFGGEGVFILKLTCHIQKWRPFSFLFFVFIMIDINVENNWNKDWGIST